MGLWIDGFDAKSYGIHIFVKKKKKTDKKQKTNSQATKADSEINGEQKFAALMSWRGNFLPGLNDLISHYIAMHHHGRRGDERKQPVHCCFISRPEL